MLRNHQKIFTQSRTSWRTIVISIIVLIIGIANTKKTVPLTQNLNSSTPTITQSPRVQFGYVQVIKVIDGDTIDVLIDGNKEAVRFIGIDTPELHDPRGGVQCFAKEAKDKAEILLAGKQVRLDADPTQGDRDKYSRLLRYVFLADGTNVNKLLIRDGYAHEYTYRIPYAYQVEFKRVEREAMEQKRGLWADGVCITPTP